MENPKFNHSGVDYKSIGTKLISGEPMSETEKSSFLEVAVKLASDIVDQRAGSSRWLTEISQDVRSHMNVIVLDRLVSLYQSGSTKMFDSLKEKVCNSLLVEKEIVTDERLYSLLSSGLDAYFDREISLEVKKCMDFIREAVEWVIPSKV